MAVTAFVIDDSAVVRKYLSATLNAGGVRVLGSASDPLFALPKLQARWPDVIVLDVEMSRMDGISFLKKLMAERPTPVVMCSTLTEKDGPTTLQAMAAGAVGFVTKPKMGLKEFLEDPDNGLVEAVKAAAKAPLRAASMEARPDSSQQVRSAVAGSMAATRRPALHAASASTTDRVIAIGISTGGVQSIEVVLRQLDRTCPGILVVQHMPASFTAAFAERLNGVCDMEVLEARDGDRLVQGRVLIAPGGRHMQLKRHGGQYVVAIQDGPLVNHHRPSVDVLFRSVAACAGPHAVGLIMTGMGDDGARGLKDMRAAGAHTAAQDEASCVVFGMPAMAIKLGAAQEVVSLNNIAPWIRHVATRPLR
ncbi:MAG: protein-glutamate methylesterase/protein-glutamine glutaminase [Acidobacteriota bacterium]